MGKKKKIGRRYESGRIEAYDNVYNYARKNSMVLNAGNRSVHNMWDYSSKQAMQTKLVELQGEDDGKIEIGHRLRAFAKLPGLLNDLRQLNAEFKQLQERKVKQGFKKPEQMPPEILAQKYELEARIDIVEAEINWLQTHIKEYQEQEDEERKDQVLKYGPMCSGHGEPLKEIDEQKTELLNIEGQQLLIITDTLSPYKGMAVCDYRQMAETWKAERRAKGVTRQTSRINKKDLPVWPEGVLSYLP